MGRYQCAGIYRARGGELFVAERTRPGFHSVHIRLVIRAKGVAVSHANLVYNQRMLQAGLKSSAETTIVSWLPVYHDLGLIANCCNALYVGSPCVLMPPMAFLQKPVRLAADDQSLSWRVQRRAELWL